VVGTTRHFGHTGTPSAVGASARAGLFSPASRSSACENNRAAQARAPNPEQRPTGAEFARRPREAVGRAEPREVEEYIPKR
jgi:hypothetical protein